MVNRLDMGTIYSSSINSPLTFRKNTGLLSFILILPILRLFDALKGKKSQKAKLSPNWAILEHNTPTSTLKLENPLAEVITIILVLSLSIGFASIILTVILL